MTDLSERDKHVEWCKQRARPYLSRGDVQGAVASMISDMDSRSDCKVNAHLAMFGIMCRNLDDARRFVEGFR